MVGQGLFYYLSQMRLALLTTCLLLSASCLAQPADTARLIDAIFTSYSNSTPGVAVAVARGNHIFYEKAFGLADLEHRVPNTTETIFESGSVAKQFTAMAILLLASEGKLALSDDIRRYIPELPVYEAPIRIQHLLNHTSGLKDWGSIGAVSGWPRTTRVYTQALALQIMARQTTLNYPPGEEYLYSNSNFSCMVTIVERVSGKSLADFTQERIFGPLKMTHTQWRDNFREIVPNRAIAYSRREGSYQQMMPFENIHGHGGLLTTVGDLVKWNQILETHAIGGDEVYQWRTQNGKLNNGTKLDYAAGITVKEYRGMPEISHSGSTAGYRAWLAYYPKQKLSVAVLSNDASTNAPRIGYDIIDIFLGKPKSMTMNEPALVRLTSDQAGSWAGIYRNTRSFDVITLTPKGTTVANGEEELKTLHADTLGLWSGKLARQSASSLVWIRGTDRLTYERMAAPATDEKSLAQYAGTFTSAEADDVWTIAVQGGKLVVLHGAFDPIALTPVFKDAFQIERYDLVEFKRDKSGGKISGFELSTTRAERIIFLKNKNK